MQPASTSLLLFDQNLSPRLVPRLAGEFPGAIHVREVGLARAGDAEVEAYALTHGLAVVTKDADFTLSFRRARVVWLRIGNGSVNEMEVALRRHAPEIIGFLGTPTARVLELG